jgi:glutamate synthase domain-containing protein 3
VKILKTVIEKIEEIAKKNPDEVTEEEKEWILTTWESIKEAFTKITNS